MGSFWGLTVGITASALLVIGSVAIILVSIALAVTVHWAFGFGIFLFPMWASAMINVIDWSVF
jgi:hypothetical protein